MATSLPTDRKAADDWIKKQFEGNGTRPGNNKTHWNRWCSACLLARIQEVVDEESTRHATGHINILRTDEDIKKHLLDNPTTQAPKPHVSKLETLLTHLKSCTNVGVAVREHATVLKACRKAGKTSLNTGKENQSCAHVPVLRGALMPHLSITPAPHVLKRSFSETAMARNMTASPHVETGHPAMMSYSPDHDALTETSYPGLLCLDEEIGQWPHQRRVEFQTDVLKLVVSGNVSFRAVSLPYWRHFFQKWIPGAPMPTRQALAGRICDAEADRVIARMKVRLRGRYGTGQSDGWKNIARTSIIASMVNAEYEPHILHAHDVTHERKTAENLLTIVEAEIDFCENVLEMIVAAWCTDGGGDCAKMRKILLRKRPHLAGPHCWSHQVRLSVGDYLKVKTPAVAVLDLALEVIKWFNNHTLALGLLRKQQISQYGRTLALIRPAPTRWTAHYHSSGRLLETEEAIRVLLLSSKAALVACAGKERAQKEKAQSLLSQIEHPHFWLLLRTVHSHLEPLAIASNATQGDNARLDVVLITLGNLYLTYSDATRFDNVTQATMHKSLEMRWKKSGRERELGILAILFHVGIRRRAFRENNPLLTPQGLWLIYKRHFVRMMKRPVDAEMKIAFMEYIQEIGEWSNENMGYDEAVEWSMHTGKPVNLLNVWRALDAQGYSGRNGLVKFAMLLLSIVPNSAAIERLFSRLGIVQNKYRNRLGPEKARKVVLVKAEIDRDYGNGRDEQRRHFGPQLEDEDSSVHSPGVPQTSATDADSISASFLTVAAELVELAAEEALGEPDAEENEPEEPDVHTLSTTVPAPLPARDIPVPRSDALMLRNLFNYPPVVPGAISAGNLLTKFWAQSALNTTQEISAYDREATEAEEDSSESSEVRVENNHGQPPTVASGGHVVGGGGGGNHGNMD